MNRDLSGNGDRENVKFYQIDRRIPVPDRGTAPGGFASRRPLG
jgi:hypothetical protein